MTCAYKKINHNQHSVIRHLPKRGANKSFYLKSGQILEYHSIFTSRNYLFSMYHFCINMKFNLELIMVGYILIYYYTNEPGYAIKEKKALGLL